MVYGWIKVTIRCVKCSLGDRWCGFHLDVPADAIEPSFVWFVWLLAEGLVGRLLLAWWWWSIFIGSGLSLGLGVAHKVLVGHQGVLPMVRVVLLEFLFWMACRSCDILSSIIAFISVWSMTSPWIFCIITWKHCPKSLNSCCTFISILSSSCWSCCLNMCWSCCCICSISFCYSAIWC